MDQAASLVKNCKKLKIANLESQGSIYCNLQSMYVVCRKKNWGALPGSAGCLKKPTQLPNAGHHIYIFKN
jgi:hypothetical protein